MRSVQDLREATVEAGRRRIRPCLMTAFTTFAALLPVMMATGRGADVARAMALEKRRRLSSRSSPTDGGGTIPQITQDSR
jgi:Cu(I)/Ag(I) efflux system membrane protein CusA/SilA